MQPVNAFRAALLRCPLIAILRGIRPSEVEAIGEALVETGIELIEVPMNSPEPLASIERLARRAGNHAIIGAGTVLRVDQVVAVEEAGGRMIISPNADVDVISRSTRRGLVSLPGIATPTEAFRALDAGATALKVFPAEGASPNVLRAMRAVLPASVHLLPVGGITPESIKPWRDAGAAGFGLGSGLYTPGMSSTEVASRAHLFLQMVKADQ